MNSPNATKDIISEELSLEQLSEYSGGFFGLLKAFAEAVIEGARQIEITQETGTLPNRFWTPITDVSGGPSGGSPNGSDCTLNDGDYGKWY
jgi:hypothetical protein